MDAHAARLLVKQEIFALSRTVVAPHLWQTILVSGAGIKAESLGELASQLGLSPTAVNLTMTLEELAARVAAESPLEVRVERRSFVF